jgi:hypothetical protein
MAELRLAVLFWLCATFVSCGNETTWLRASAEIFWRALIPWALARLCRPGLGGKLTARAILWAQAGACPVALIIMSSASISALLTVGQELLRAAALFRGLLVVAGDGRAGVPQRLLLSIPVASVAIPAFFAAHAGWAAGTFLDR